MTSPPQSEYQERIFNALTKLLGQKDELTSAITKLFHQQQLHETRTAGQFERVEETLKGMQSRISKLEEGAEDTGQFHVHELENRLQSERVRAHEYKHLSLKVAGSIALLIIGGIVSFVVSWLVKR